MLLRTFYTTLLSFFIVLVPSIFIEKWYELKDGDFSFDWQWVWQIVFYSIPIMGLGFLILLAINLLTSYMIWKGYRLKRFNLYLLVALAISLLPILSFVLFDYFTRGRYFEEKTFISIFFDYSPLLIWATLAIFLNWRYIVKRLNLH
jgi:cation transport ATPase